MANLTETFTVSLSDRISGFKSSLVKRYTDYRLYQRSVNELSQLSTRELNDLGLTRGSIRSVARETVNGL